MQSFDLSELFDQYSIVNKSVQEFADNLSVLANHVGGQSGVDETFKRVQQNIANGLPIEESLVEAYRHLRNKLV